MNWIVENWHLIALAVSVLSTVLVKVIDFYGSDNPRLKRALRFVLSLLSLLPAKGASSRGMSLGALQVPLLSWSSARPKSDRESGFATVEGSIAIVVACVLIAIVILLQSCAGWQQNLRTSLTAAGRAADVAVSAAKDACDNVKDRCIADRENPCRELLSCHDVERTVHRAALAAHISVLSGLSAVEVADKPGAEKALQRALELVGPLIDLAKSGGTP